MDITLKDYTIYDLPHPKLSGRYEVWFGDEKFVGRFETLKDVKREIKKIKASRNVGKQ